MIVEENNSNVNHPEHYNGNTSLECIDCMRVAFGATAVYHFCLCNAFKYLWRYKNKNGKEDIRKAQWYLDYVKKDIDTVDILVIEPIITREKRLRNLLNSLIDKGEI